MQEGKKKKSILSTMMSVTGIVLLSKLFGFVKQIIIANAFGATIQTDIISLSEGLIANTDYLLIQALSTAFIPTYIYLKSSEGDNNRIFQFVSNTIIFFFTITVCISFSFIVFSPIIAKILAPSYSNELSNLLTKYIRLYSPLIILIVELAVFNALLKANEHFIPGELIGFNQSVILIFLTFLIGDTYGPDTLVIGYYTYAVYNLFFLAWFSRKYWTIKIKNPFIDKNVQKMVVMMGPLLLGYSMVFVNQQVDKVIVSGLGEGTITAMGYASVLSNFICTFIGSICGILFTYITQKIAVKDNEGAAQLTSKMVVLLVTVLLPISILTVLNSKDIVNAVFGRGKFDSKAVTTCAYALVGYGLMFIPYIIKEMFSRVQYAYGDSKQPMINSSIGIFVNIFMSILLSRYIGVLGVTISTSISVLVCGILNMKYSYKTNGFFSDFNYREFLPKWFCGSALCVIVSEMGKMIFVQMPSLLRFIIITIVSFSFYFIVVFSIVKPVLMQYVNRRKIL